MRDIRWAIVGTGAVAGRIAPDFPLAEGAELVAVCSRTAEAGGEFARAHRIPRVHSAYVALLADAEIDAVYLATPHITHHRLALEALDAGKHVLVEKPMGMEAREVREIAAAARRNGLLAMEAMWMRFSPLVAAVRETIARGEIGEVRSVRASFGMPFPRDVGSRWSAEMGGSVLLDQGIYPVTLASLLLGSPDGLTARRSVQDDGVDHSVHMTLEFSEGRFAQLSASMTEYIDPSATISGTAGWIQLEAPFWSGAIYRVHAGDIGTALFRPTRHEVAIEGHGYVPMLRAFTAAILSGDVTAVEQLGRETAQVFDILDAVKEGAVDG